MSDSFPYSGVVSVEVIRYAVVTQACRLSPSRSSAIVRMDVLTMVWSSEARNIPAISPARMVRICRWLSSGFRSAGAAREVVIGVLSPTRSLNGRAAGPTARRDGHVEEKTLEVVVEPLEQLVEPT